MKLLSIDQSISNTGIAIFQGGYLLDYSNLKSAHTSQNDPLGELRIFYMVNNITRIILEEGIEIVCLEEVGSVRNGRVTKMLAGLRHSITYQLNTMNMLYHVIPATAHKARESKQMTLDRVKAKYKITDIIDDNVADAISLGDYFVNNINVEKC